MYACMWVRFCYFCKVLETKTNFKTINHRKYIKKRCVCIMKQISLCERLNFRISASEASLYIKTHIRPRHHSLHPFRTELVPHIQK